MKRSPLWGYFLNETFVVQINGAAVFPKKEQ